MGQMANEIRALCELACGSGIKARMYSAFGLEKITRPVSINILLNSGADNTGTARHIRKDRAGRLACMAIPFRT